MADKGPGSTARSANKRLARAKIKSTDNGIKSSKGRAVIEEEKLSQKQEAEERKKRLMRIGIGVFAVIMALSMMLPSLTYIFGNKNPEVQQREQQAQAEAAQQEAEQKKTEGEEKNLTGVELVDSNYKAVVDPLEAKLKDNDKDLATLLSLGEDYTSWAAQVAMYGASDDSAKAHSDELYKKALDYYDRYLAINDSEIVKASRAMCQYSSGDKDGAIGALEKLTQDKPEFAVAWLDLGMIYEQESNTDKAKEAYTKAAEVDPNDEYAAKTRADQRLAALAAQEGNTLDDDASQPQSEDNSATNKLEDALNTK